MDPQHRAAAACGDPSKPHVTRGCCAVWLLGAHVAASPPLPSLPSFPGHPAHRTGSANKPRAAKAVGQLASSSSPARASGRSPTSLTKSEFNHHTGRGRRHHATQKPLRHVFFGGQRTGLQAGSVEATISGEHGRVFPSVLPRRFKNSQRRTFLKGERKYSGFVSCHLFSELVF